MNKEDLKVINEILSNKDTSVEYLGKSKMFEDDKQLMYKYEITINNEIFNYYEGLGFEEDNDDVLVNGVMCLISDYKTIDYITDLDDFIEEFGYDNYYKAKMIYNLMIKNYKKMNNVFTEEEIDKLTEMEW